MDDVQHDPETTPEAEGSPRAGFVGRVVGGVGGAVGRSSGLISAGLLVAAVAGMVVAARPLEAKVVTIQAAAPRVAFEWPSLRGEVSSEPREPGGEPRTWVNGEIRRELEGLVLSKLSSDPFDGEALRAAHGALMATGWFRPGLTLSRGGDGTVSVRGEWRLPAAAVRHDGSDMLVSSAGELLPVKYKPGGSGFKAIVGVFHEPPKPGEAWMGGDVKAALRLLELLARVPGYEQVAGIDVTDYAGKRSMTIVTDAGGRVQWGGPVDEFNPGQAEPLTKLARLVQLHRDYGRIDAGRAAIDVRLADNVYVLDTGGVLKAAAAADPEAKPAKKPEKTPSRRQARR